MGAERCQTLVEVLRHHAAERGAAPACVQLDAAAAPARDLSFADLDRTARGIAAELQRDGLAGERALLLYPSGVDFAAAFWGCLYAGVLPVPAPLPHPRRSHAGTAAIVADCRPRAVLTTAETTPVARRRLAGLPGLARTRWLASDEVATGRADDWRAPAATPDDVAFLQYTSGSTSDPKGVMVTHGNLVHNCRLLQRQFGWNGANLVAVTWLPLYHDMGLIGHLLGALFLGAPCYLMSPLDFLQQPVAWLRAITRYRGSHSTVPNFAYELCLRRVADEQKAGLDLSSWRWAGNGSEPVRGETIERFAARFADVGYARRHCFPCYGLAEGTLIVTGGPRRAPPVTCHVDAAALEQHRVARVAPHAPGARCLVSSGRARLDQRVAIVEPQQRRRLPDDAIGEVWVSGPSVAAGYWGRGAKSAEVFAAELADGDGQRYLRTGDLGFVTAGQLFVTGRLKDIIIVMGRNHYPQDIEATAGGAHPALRGGGGAAFAVEADGEQRLIVVHEVGRDWLRALDATAVGAALREAVTAEHDLRVHEAVLVFPGSVPKTSSGKVKRYACSEQYLAGELRVVGGAG